MWGIGWAALDPAAKLWFRAMNFLATDSQSRRDMDVAFLSGGHGRRRPPLRAISGQVQSGRYRSKVRPEPPYFKFLQQLRDGKA